MGDTETVAPLDMQEVIPEPAPEFAPEPELDVATAIRQLREQTKALLEATKTAQGQARRAEQQALAAMQSSLAGVRQPPAERENPVDKLLGELDDADPATRNIKHAIRAVQAENRRLASEVGVLAGHRQREQITQAEQDRRSYDYANLVEHAEDLGVDISALPEIGRLPTQEMWTEGKRLLREAKKDGRALRSAPASEHVAAARERGVYAEARPGQAGSSPRTKAQMEQAYIDGEVSSEAYTAWQRAHPR